MRNFQTDRNSLTFAVKKKPVAINFRTIIIEEIKTVILVYTGTILAAFFLHAIFFWSFLVNDNPLKLLWCIILCAGTV